ncbi:MAG: EscU/YscU/HrcU family type III secretion system export apparatus switch protein [Gemmatimonadetes bacterium]|nr:EscU/YscU/HrcU family type III secretion system export apparatus switch protein [Gemmatimonadota bacterium]
MAEDSDLERTEEPTQRRRDEARQEGRVPRSQELITAMLFLGGAVMLQRLGTTGAPALASSFRGALRTYDGAAEGGGALLTLLTQTARNAVGVAAVLAASVALGALVVSAVQARGVLTWKPVTPQWNRLDPMANFKRVVGIGTLAELLRSLFKLAIVAGVTWRVVGARWPELAALAGRAPIALLDSVHQTGVALLRSTGIAYLAFAALDYGWQLWRHRQSMLMTKAEVREEMKRQEGDPMLKARIRAIGRSRLRRRMMQDVPKADVVIVNPTHVAVALRYDPLVAPAPVIVAMGERLIAQRIRDIAESHHITIVQNKPLARALLASARVGSVIPAELYAAVAEVLAFVFRSRRALGQSGEAR